MTSGNLRHADIAENPLTFDRAYDLIEREPERLYRTTNGATPFVARADRTVKGKRVIRFLSTNRVQRACAYECCWGHRTNCYRTDIDGYTSAIAQEKV